MNKIAGLIFGHWYTPLIIAFVVFYFYRIIKRFCDYCQNCYYADMLKSFIDAYDKSEPYSSIMAKLERIYVNRPNIENVNRYFKLERNTNLIECSRICMGSYEYLDNKRDYLAHDFRKSFSPIDAIQGFLDIPLSIAKRLGFNISGKNQNKARCIGAIIGTAFGAFCNEMWPTIKPVLIELLKQFVNH